VETACDLLTNTKPKVAVTYIHYRSHAELADMKQYMEFGAPCGMASTVYTVEGAYADRYCAAMFSVFMDQIVRGYGHTDETCMVYCYDKYPELFTLNYGDYYSVITNYHGVREDKEAVRRYFIEEAERKGRSDLAQRVIQTFFRTE
jgi:hypothetical protein